MRLLACLGTEVQEDGIGLPVAQGLDGSLVDTRDEEGCCSPGSQAVGFDTGRGDVCDVLNISGGCMEFGGDVRSGDLEWLVSRYVVGVQRTIGWCIAVALQVLYVELSGMDGAQDGVS